MQRVHINIHGRVQGVFFRAHAQVEAQKLSLTGWVRNLDDGGVEIVAEGPKNALEKLVEWCGKGPPSAKVDSVQVEWMKATGEFGDFSVRIL